MTLTPACTDLRCAELVGVDIPRAVVRRKLQVVLCHVLVAASPALRGNPGNHVPVTKVNTDVLLVVRDTGRPRTATYRQ